MNKNTKHLIVLGDFNSDACGLAVIQSWLDPCKVRELATHSASIGMALKPLADMAQAVFCKMPENPSPYWVEIKDRVERAYFLLREAEMLNNPDRRKKMECKP